MQARSTLAADFARLGLNPGQLVVVHSSLSSIGYVLGGAQTVVRALLDTIGFEGTLVMPAFSPEVSDPANWTDHQFRDDELGVAQEEVPAFDPTVTPTSMGAIAEAFRTWPGVVRSAHPQVSVAARGPLADRIISPHELAWAQGAGSPFQRLYDLNAKLLLLGVGFNRATMLHYAESLVPHGRQKTRRIPIDQDGKRVWASPPDVGDDLNTYFPLIGEQFVRSGRASTGRVGRAHCMLASCRDVVDFAKQYLSEALAK